MTDTTDPLYPSGNESEPVIYWINRSIKYARFRLQRERPEMAKDPFYVLVYALNVIIKTREHHAPAGVQGLPYPNCGNMHLVYADHYLQMRCDAFNLGPKSAGFLQKRGKVYDDVKPGMLRHSVTRWMLKTGVCDPSPVTDEEKYWAQRGLKDGLADYARYPNDSIFPMRHPLLFSPL